MSVYFATCREANAVKIGSSLEPWSRLREIQLGCPLPITIEAVLPGGCEEEFTFHRRFADDRIRGEWFTITEMIELIIAANPAPAKPEKPQRAERSRETKVRKVPNPPRATSHVPSIYRSGGNLPLGCSERHDRKRYQAALAEMRAAQSGEQIA